MTPYQKVKHLVLLRLLEWDANAITTAITEENIDVIYGEVEDKYDAISEVRGGEIETDLKSPYSRHYESKEVAAKYIDGSWIGWTYWYGGGKHSEPEAIDWMNDAYSVDCKEEEKMVLVRTFSKIAA